MPHLPLGQTLVELGHITADQLADALERQGELPGTRIGRILVQLGISELVVTEALAKQAGVAWMRLSDRILPSDLAHRIPSEYARRNRYLPVEMKDGIVTVAVTDPESLSQVGVMGKAFGGSVVPVLVPDSEMDIALDRVYGRAKEPPPHSKDGRSPVRVGGGAGAPPASALDATDSDPSLDAAAVRVLDALLARAVRDGASDIHLEPFDKILRARLRIDGVLHEVTMEDVPARALAARCKILASLDTAENRRPQDGRFRVPMPGAPVDGHGLDVRVSTVPTAFGEKVVMRLLDRTRALLDLSHLGMNAEHLEQFRALIRRPHGLILVTGPTGSGKTTTLYAALSERNGIGLNIMTIEDPIEYDLFGVNQIQVHPKIDLTFARGLRHVLRQDPDIILVGEIRDRETAEVAIQAAMTGHLVLSTLHTNDAVGAIARLMDMGVEPFLAADAITGVLSQRLVRRLCPHCAQEDVVSPAEARQFALSPDIRVRRPKGCSHCMGTGFRGRVGVYELLRLTPTLSSLIREQAHSGAVVAAAQAEGHISLRHDGIEKAISGITTLDEVERVS